MSKKIPFLEMFAALTQWAEFVNAMEGWEGSQLNKAKEILAYELTKLVHGEEEANKAKKAAEALFGGAGNTQDMPTVAAETGKKLLDVLTAGKVFASKSEGRRLIQQNGLSLNDAKVTDVDYILQASDFTDGEAIVKKGKKKYFKLVK